MNIDRERISENPEVNIYRLTDIVPNEDGLYEIPRSVHFVYPAMDAQNFLQEMGFVYVSHKKGNYDIELWRKVEDEGGKEIAELLELTVDDTGISDVHPLAITPKKCQYCGMRIDEVGYILGSPTKYKSVQISICINPACNFHYVDVQRG